MAQDINEINKQIAELSRQLGKTPDSPFKESELKKAELALKGLSAELREMSGDLDYISKSFKDSVNELSRQNVYLSSAKKSLTGISDLSKQLVDFRRGENTLSEKQLTTLKDKARIHFEELAISVKSGKLGQSNQFLAEQALADQDLFVKGLDRTIELQQQVNKEVGLLGQGIEGAGKFLEKMGFAGLAKPLSDAIDKTKQARLQTKLNGDAIAENNKELEKLNRPYKFLTEAEKDRKKELLQSNLLLKDQNKELATQTNKYRNILSSLKEQFTMTNLIDASVGKIVEGFLEVNKASVEYQRLTGQNASALAGQNSSLATSAQVLTLMGELTKQTGIAANAIFSGKDLGRLAEAQNLLGLSAEQAGKLGMQSKLSNTSIEDYEKNIVGSVNTFNKLNGTAVSHGVVMQDVLSTSEDITLAMGNSSVEITKAAAAARGLGLNLERVDQIAGTLMNFEDSIGAELEAQLLTGKDINLSKARELAMNNDLAGLSEELKKNGASAAEYAGMNRIQQEALAKSLGMSRQELAKSIMTQEASKNLTDDQRAAAMGVTVEQMKQMDIQQKMDTALSKLAQAFAPILDIAVVLVDAFASMLSPISYVVSLVAGNPIGKAILLAVVATNLLGISVKGVGSAFGSMYSLGAKALTGLTGLFNKGAAGEMLGGIKEKLTNTKNSIVDSFKQGASATPAAQQAVTGGADKSVQAANSASKAQDPKSSGEKLKEFFTNLAAGLKEMASMKVVGGALALIPASIGLVAMIPGVLGAKLLEKLDGEKLKTSLSGLASGLTEMASMKVAGGALALILASTGLTLLIPGIAGGLLLAAAATPISVGLNILGTALASFGALMAAGGLLGVGALAAAAIALGVALNIAAPGIEAFGTVLTSAFAGLGTVITAVADGFVTMMGAVTMDNIAPMLLLGPALFGIAGGLAAIALAGPMAIPALLAVGAVAGVASVTLGGGSSSVGESKSKAEEGSLAEVSSKLETLIQVVRQGGNIYMDGKHIAHTVNRTMPTYVSKNK